MAAPFDHNDMNSWYFSKLTRAEATQMLMDEKESGVFLVRDSNTIQGDYVLCVREDGRVSHYIINRVIQTDGATRFRIGDQLFPDLPALLSFYRLHYLDSTPLVRPLILTPHPAAAAVIETVMAKFDFDGRDVDDLPFRRGEVLYVLCKDEEQWWTARNTAGNTGSIPVPYIMRYVETSANSNNANVADSPSQAALNNVHQDGHHTPTNSAQHTPGKTSMQRALPAMARVKQSRVPNAYDNTALRLELGDMVKVTKMNINGQWEGELKGRVGHFPFTHVEFVDDSPATMGNGS